MTRPRPPVGPKVSDDFLALLRKRDRRGALALVNALVADGVSPTEIIECVLAPAQRSVGDRWERGEWTVSQEHAATAITETVLAALPAPELPDGPRGRVVLACSEHEWHSLPARMLAELLRARAWDVTFLGASTSTDDLRERLRMVDPVATVVSCSVAINLPGAARVIDAAHASGYRVLAGGPALPSVQRADALGADAWAGSIQDLDDILAGWQIRPSPPRAVARVGAVPASTIIAAEPRLVDQAVQELRARVPSVATYDARRISRVRADFGYMIGFAAAAILIQDDTVFHDFTDWLTGILGRLGFPDLAHLRGALSAVSSDQLELVTLLDRAAAREPSDTPYRPVAQNT